MLKKVLRLIFVSLFLAIPIKAYYEEVVLKDGVSVSSIVVRTMRITIDRLLEREPMILLHSIEKAKDPDYKIPSSAEVTLTKLAILQNGEMHDMVRTIILSFVEEEDFNLKLMNALESVMKDLL